MDAHQLAEWISYNPETGEFVWKIGRRAGRHAGHIGAHGYVGLSVKGFRIPAHRAAWLLTHGRLPAHLLDHINGVRTDNRLCNLREVSWVENRQNQTVCRRDSKNRFRGVMLSEYGKFRAHVTVKGRRYYFGNYESPELAYAAALEGKRKLHSGFAG